MNRFSLFFLTTALPVASLTVSHETHVQAIALNPLTAPAIVSVIPSLIKDGKIGLNNTGKPQTVILFRDNAAKFPLPSNNKELHPLHVGGKNKKRPLFKQEPSPETRNEKRGLLGGLL